MNRRLRQTLSGTVRTTLEAVLCLVLLLASGSCTDKRPPALKNLAPHSTQRDQNLQELRFKLHNATDKPLHFDPIDCTIICRHFVRILHNERELSPEIFGRAFADCTYPEPRPDAGSPRFANRSGPRLFKYPPALAAGGSQTWIWDLKVRRVDQHNRCVRVKPAPKLEEITFKMCWSQPSSPRQCRNLSHQDIKAGTIEVLVQ